MYAMLVLRRRSGLETLSADGVWTSDTERVAASLLPGLRDAARHRHDVAVREYDADKRRLERALAAWEDSHDARLRAYLTRCRVQASAELQGFVRVRLPTGETLDCPLEHVEIIARDHLDIAEPAPVLPTDDDAPLAPSDAELLDRFAPEAETRRAVAWEAHLTREGHDAELARAHVDDLSSGPPAAFVVGTLNLVAREGWAVDHVSEDRVRVNEVDQLVRVRYLLVLT